VGRGNPPHLVMAAATRQQLKLLAPYLEGDRPTHENDDGTKEWNILCPLHDDSKRSASINVDKGVFYCFVCGGMSIKDLVVRRDEWHLPHATTSSNGRRGASRPTRVLTEAMVDGWHNSLLARENRLSWLHERRGITTDTIDQYRIGWEESGAGHFTIPIFDETGKLANIRYYDPFPTEGRRKIWSEKGYGGARLYPLSVFDDDPDEILILAGEWDTLLALQHGYTAITRTSSEVTWRSEWGHWFKDRRVFVCQDADAAGQRSNRKIATALKTIAQSLSIIKLPYKVQEKNGKDITDVFEDFGPNKLRELMESVISMPSIKRAALIDAFDHELAGQPLNMEVTIRGRQEPGYLLPKKIKMTCTQDAGAKCVSCPMKGHQGETTLEIGSDEPIILDLIESTATRRDALITSKLGVPGGKCIKLLQEVEEYHSVEILFARSPVDRVEVDIPKTLKITYVGKHDVVSNNTVEVTGTLMSSPHSHRKEFLSNRLEYKATAIDNFEVSSQSIEMMRVFQPVSGETLLQKLGDIARNLAEHVTLIHGRPEMHMVMDLTYHSVLSFDFGNERVDRGWLDSLIVGDTRTGKSLAAVNLTRHYGGGEIINCEAASFAGVIGGVQQFGNRDWIITWGAVPMNDRRLVVLDEMSALDTEDISKMSEVRSSGRAKITKITQDETSSRTRLLWLGNPRNGKMNDFTYGVDAIKPLIGNDEDIARFDLAMALTSDDVPADQINVLGQRGSNKYTTEECHTMMIWCWTRKPEHIKFSDLARKRTLELANKLGRMYTDDPPLIQAASVRIKIARIAAAIAARTFSTDETCENVIVARPHVEAAVKLINILYSMPRFGYLERSREVLGSLSLARGSREPAMQFLKGYPGLIQHLRSQGRFRRQDLEEMLDIDRLEANTLISQLFGFGMIRRVKGDIIVQPALHEILREERHL
jgi:MCM P-loop domain/CHC2 zinc finger